jgi:hypothetical protein
MSPIVQSKRSEIIDLCRKFHVVELYLFGSGATDELNEASDLDFLVSLGDCTAAESAHRYFGLLAALQDLFQRNIDLVEIEAISNPYFMRDVEATRSLLYAA